MASATHKSALLALLWTALGAIGATLCFFWTMLANMGGMRMHDHGGIPILMSMTITPFIAAFGWIPVVYCIMKRPQHTGKAGVTMLTMSISILIFNAMLAFALRPPY